MIRFHALYFTQKTRLATLAYTMRTPPRVHRLSVRYIVQRRGRPEPDVSQMLNTVKL
jgi:hypothetical protein